MADTVKVVYLIAGTVQNQTFTAKRITYQRWRKRGVIVHLWKRGRVHRAVSYRRAEVVDKVTK